MVSIQVFSQNRHPIKRILTLIFQFPVKIKILLKDDLNSISKQCLFKLIEHINQIPLKFVFSSKADKRF